MSLLGLDIGTSGCKAAVFREDGALLALARASYPLHTSAQGWLELDALEVWAQLSGCIRQANAHVRHDPVRALAVSVLGEAVIPVDRTGTPLSGSPVSFDTRARKQVASFRRKFGESEAYSITGQPIHPMYSIHKIAWWRAEQPELFRSAWKFLCYGDFVTCMLGLPPTIDHSMAARTQAFDIRSRQWSGPILDWAGIDAGRLAAVAPAGAVVGTVEKHVAQELGFAAEVTVVAGGHDQPCGALGSGALGNGEAMFALGTTACIAPTLAAPVLALAGDGFPCYPHVIPQRYVTLAGTSSGGSLLRWFRDLFGDREQQIAEQSGRDVYDVMLEGLGDEPGRLILLPHFAGTEAPHHDPQAKGALLGLTFNTNRDDVIKAILEGIALEMASYVAHLGRAGVEIARLRAIGGGAQSARWMQINADVIGVPVAVPRVTEATCLGAALLAGCAAGCYDSLDQAVAQVIGVDRVFEPRSDQAAFYRERLAVYERVYPALSWLNPLLT